MTYAQIKQIETFIIEIDNLIVQSNNTGDSYYKMAKALDEKINASVTGYKFIDNGWEDTVDILPGGDFQVAYNRDSIIGKLKVMKSSLQGLLNSIPNYERLKSIEKDIATGKDTTEEKQSNFIVKMYEKYSGELTFSQMTKTYVEKCIDGSWYEDTTTSSIYEAIIEKLTLYLHDMQKEPIEKQHKSANAPVINVTQTNQQSQTMTSNIEVTFEECLKELDDCESINEDEISELKTQIAEIQEMLNNKKGNKKAIREKIATILKWTADKATDVMIAVLPVLLESLKNVK